MQFETVSMCPICYREIPATVFDRDHAVYMRKTCCGTHETVVDPDATFYALSRKIGGELPPEHQVCLIDVTSRCNAKCKHCYFPVDNSARDKLIDRILQEVRVIRDHYGVRRIVFTGGEPTVREDFIDLVNAVAKENVTAEFLTNGIRLVNERFFEEVVKSSVSIENGGKLGIYMSMHLGGNRDAKMGMIRHLRTAKLKILCLLYTVDNILDVNAVLNEVVEIKDVAAQFRIRASAPHWRTRETQARQIYASDLFRQAAFWAEQNGVKLAPAEGTDSMHYRFNCDLDGTKVRFIHWPTEWNIDLQQHLCGPFYRAKNGKVAHFIESILINQGMEAGFIDGETWQPIPDMGNGQRA